MFNSWHLWGFQYKCIISWLTAQAQDSDILGFKLWLSFLFTMWPWLNHLVSQVQFPHLFSETSVVKNWMILFKQFSIYSGVFLVSWVNTSLKSGINLLVLISPASWGCLCISDICAYMHIHNHSSVQGNKGTVSQAFLHTLTFILYLKETLTYSIPAGFRYNFKTKY